jgi:predicted Fe-S protein YdhL (DUF1289 family)
MLSPCVGICELTPSGVCRGCLRTSEEITHWTTYTPEHRSQIVHDLDERAFDDNFNQSGDF